MCIECLKSSNTSLLDGSNAYYNHIDLPASAFSNKQQFLSRYMIPPSCKHDLEGEMSREPSSDGTNTTLETPQTISPMFSKSKKISFATSGPLSPNFQPSSYSPKPIFTHKLPDNFFASSSPPLPLSPIDSSLYASKQNTPISSPKIHPKCLQTSSACSTLPQNSNHTAVSCIKEPVAKVNEILPPVTNTPCSTYNNITQQQLRRRMCLDDFKIKQTVGTGSSARVHLAKSHINGKYYAIKAISKKELVSNQQIEHVHNEKEVLSSISHTFVVKLWGTFQSESHVFLVMDYVPGGELFRLIRKHKRLSEDDARFYAAEVILAIEYLHSKDVAYRDLKPENILIDHQGHIKLTDFGFAKKVLDMTWTVCGTPDYIAPEIIRSQGYTKAVDWWSIGVLVFEMLTGHSPFTAKNPIDQYQKILERDLTWPDYISCEARDLLENLLKTKSSERFGNLKNGVNDIKNHAWFMGLDFDKVVATRKMKPPFVPDLKSAGDTHCFDYHEEISIPYNLIQSSELYCTHFPHF